MATDAMDQLFWHGELFTGIVEKTTMLFAYALVFLGLRKWLKEYQELKIQYCADAIYTLTQDYPSQ